MGLQQSDTLLAPVYDAVVNKATAPMRKDSWRAFTPSESDSTSLQLNSDEPCLAGGWFRRIQLHKQQ